MSKGHGNQPEEAPTEQKWGNLKISKDSNCNEVKCIKNVAISELKERERERREGRRKGKKEVKNN